MNNLVKSLDEQIEIDKEVIELSPKSGVKQIREFKKKLEEMIELYTAINESAMEEIKARYERIDSITMNEEITKVSENIYKLDNLVLSEKGKTSFERMNFDRLTYRINGYYKKNLSIINQDIMACINKFKEVGIKLTGKDFQISEYANEYMTVLLEEDEKGDINSDRVKDAFEKVYWKSSDLIIHILVNIRQLYDSNELAIDKYYKNKTEEVLRTLGVTERQVQDKKDELIRKLNALRAVDGRIILDSFIDGRYSIGDYRKDTYSNIYENLTSKSMSELSAEQKRIMDENLKKLDNNLSEYTNFLEFKFIFDETLNLKKLREKENAANPNVKGKGKVLSNTQLIKNDITKMSAEIKKINDEIREPKTKKFSILSLFKKKALPRKSAGELVLERDNKILELKELYIKLDDSKLKDQINEHITDTSKIYDVFRIASYDYSFLAKTIIKKYKDIVEEDINKMIERFIIFIRLSHFSVLNNINISEKKDIAVVIKDKHKLLGVEISKEHFADANFDEFVKQVQIIDYYNDIERSNIPLEDIQFIINARAVLK